MKKYLFLISCILCFSCNKKKLDSYSKTFYKEKYEDFFIGQCFYYYTDDKSWRDVFPCSSYLNFDEREIKYLDSLIVSLRFELNSQILEKSEGGYSMYFYGKYGKNILEDSLKSSSIESVKPDESCVAQVCMKVVRSKEFQKRAGQYADKRFLQYKKNPNQYNYFE